MEPMDTCSTKRPPVHGMGTHSRTPSQIETPICTPAAQLIRQHTCGALDGSPMECGLGGQSYETPHFHPLHRHPPSWSDSPMNIVEPLRTVVGHFRSCLYKWVMDSSAACECGPEEQTVDRIVLECTIHRRARGLRGLTVMDSETIEWLPRDLVRPSSGQWPLIQTTEKNRASREYMFMSKKQHFIWKTTYEDRSVDCSSGLQSLFPDIPHLQQHRPRKISLVAGFLLRM